MSSSEEVSWVSWSYGLHGNELFYEVEEKYTKHLFYLIGLSVQVQALDMIFTLKMDEEGVWGQS